MSDPNAGPIPAQPGGPPPGYQAQPGQPIAPPPGQPQPGQPIAPPPGWNPAAAPGVAAAPTGAKPGLPALLAVVSVAAIALSVSLEEDGDNGWGRIGVWAGFAIFSAVLTLAPALRDQLNLSTEKAWRVGAAGAIGLAAFWVLFVLPSISMNVSFGATVGLAAGAGAAWLAPGRPNPPGPGQSW